MRNLPSLSDLQTQFSTGRGQVEAVDGLDLTVGEGETVGLVDESGSGKNVTVLSAMGLVDDPGEIVSGPVELENGRLAEEFREEYNNPAFVDSSVVNFVGALKEAPRVVRGRELDMILQDPMTSPNPSLTIGEQVAESLRLRQYGGRHKDLWFNAVRELLPRISRDIDDETVEWTIEVLESVGIPESGVWVGKSLHEFSGGMRRRVPIAAALVCQPRVLVADEPITAPDVTVQAQILGLVDDLQENLGMSVLMTIHDLGAVAETCDRVAVMYIGEIVGEGPVEEIFHNSSHPYTYTLIESLLSENKKRLTPIEGNVPDFIDMPEGCHLMSRCSWAQPECTSDEIPHKQHGDDEVDHRSKCVLDDFSTSGYGGDVIETSTGTEPLDMLLFEVDGMQKYYEQADDIPDRFFGADDRSVKAVDGVDLTVYRGETPGLVGESGCGKSTAGRSPLHLTSPTGGRVVFSGTDLSGLDSDELRVMHCDMQMIFQDPISSLDLRMMTGQAIREPFDIHDLPESDPNVRGEADATVTGIDAECVSVTTSDEIDAIVGSSNGVAIAAVAVAVVDGEVDVAIEERLRTEVEVERESDVVSSVTVRVTPSDSTSEHRRRRVRQLLDTVGLESGQHDRYSHELSDGQRQRVGIVHALAVDPDFITTDKPVSALDVSMQAQILSLSEGLQKRFGLTYLFIVHDLSVVRHISDRVAVMYLGEIVEVAATDELFDGPRHLYTQVLLSVIPEPDLAAETDDCIILEGDMPSLVNPPSGCYFRMRCPQVTPPADLDIEQAVYREVMDLRQRVECEVLDVETACDAALDADDPSAEVAVGADGGTTDAVVGEPHGSHLSYSLSPEPRGVVDHAFECIVADDWDETGEILRERFESACERDALELGERTHPAARHLVDE